MAPASSAPAEPTDRRSRRSEPKAASTASTASTRTAATGGARPRRAPWWLRVAAWLLAVPLGLALVGVPARRLGYLDSQKLLDVLIGEDVDRYVPLVVIVVLWALVTALLVQLIVEGGGRYLRRRRARRVDAA